MPRPGFAPIPASAQQRAVFSANLQAQVGELVLSASTSLPAALATPLSASAAFFDSPQFAAYRKLNESKQQLAVTIIQQIGSVVQAIGGLMKALRR